MPMGNRKSRSFTAGGPIKVIKADGSVEEEPGRKAGVLTFMDERPAVRKRRRRRRRLTKKELKARYEAKPGKGFDLPPIKSSSAARMKVAAPQEEGS